VLIAGATGSGKGSVIRALLPTIVGGWVQVWALDPKRMELSFGRALFHRYACHATAMVELVEAAVAAAGRCPRNRAGPSPCSGGSRPGAGSWSPGRKSHAGMIHAGKVATVICENTCFWVVIDGETAAVVPRTTTSEVRRYKPTPPIHAL
jgi:hypothetical protein